RSGDVERGAGRGREAGGGGGQGVTRPGLADLAAREGGDPGARGQRVRRDGECAATRVCADGQGDAGARGRDRVAARVLHRHLGLGGPGRAAGATARLLGERQLGGCAHADVEGVAGRRREGPVGRGQRVAVCRLVDREGGEGGHAARDRN